MDHLHLSHSKPDALCSKQSVGSHLNRSLKDGGLFSLTTPDPYNKLCKQTLCTGPPTIEGL